MSFDPRRLCIYVLTFGLGAAGCQTIDSGTQGNSNDNIVDFTGDAGEFDVMAEPKAVSEPGVWRFMIMRGGSLADDEFTYEWNIDGGQPLVGAFVEYTFEQPGSYRISVTAHAPDGGIAFIFYRDIEVREILALSLNNPPVADAGEDLTVAAGELVILDGSGSADEDGDPLTFIWEQTGGTAVELESAGSVDAAMFTAPGAPGDRLQFRLIVSDPETSSADTVEVLVAPTVGVAGIDCPVVFDVVGGSGDNPIVGTVPFSVDLTATTPDGGALPAGEYTWLINGEEDSGPVDTHGTLTHQFNTVGTYSITLLVTLAGATAPLGCERSEDGQQAKVVSAQAADGGGDNGGDASECQINADCDDSNPCTDDTCDPSGICLFSNDDTNSCDDGQFCNGQETCSAGSCQSSGDPCPSGETCSESNDTCVAAPAGNVIYIDNDGSQQSGWDPNAPAGSVNHPYSTLQAGANVAQPGDTVLIRAGTYTAPTGGYNTPVLNIVTGGSANAPIRFQNFNDEKVIIDAEAVLSGTQNGHRRGIFIPGNVSYIELSGLLVRNAHREGILVNGSHVTIEDCIVENCGLNPNNAESMGIKFNYCQFYTARRCVVRHCYAGIISKGASDGLYEDCMAYNCGFTSQGTPIYPENADGLGASAARTGSDRLRIIRGIAFENGDDQIDLSHSRDSTAESCVGFNGNARNLPNGDGNGYKVGNDQNEPIGSGRECRRLLVRNCIALANKMNGIDPRDGIDGVFYNNTAYGNQGQFGYSTGATTHAAIFYNNLSWGNQHSDLFKGDQSKIADYNNWADSGGAQVPGGDANSIRANPGFSNPTGAIDVSWQGFASDDVRGNLPTLNHIRNQILANLALTNTNPSTTSIDRGTFITRTSSGGNGVLIPVTDDATRRFRVGDEIQVQDSGRAHVVSLSTSAITVDTPLTFTSGAGVHLPYNGSAPDMGAVESP